MKKNISRARNHIFFSVFFLRITNDQARRREKQRVHPNRTKRRKHLLQSNETKPTAAVEEGGAGTLYMRSRRHSHAYNPGTEHVVFSPTRQTCRAPRAEGREVFL